MKLLNVKQTTSKEVQEQWGLNLPSKYIDAKELFVRCNEKGIVNWESAPVYLKEELEERGDYQIIIVLNISEFEDEEF